MTVGPSSGTAVSLRQITKKYGERRAVDGISLDVAAGELVAVLGPNGAGKTTTIEMVEGYRRPDSGEVRVFGMDPVRQRTACLPLLGIMLQEGGVYPTLSVAEAVALFAAYFADPDSPDAVLERVGLTDRRRTRYRQLSGGEKQRLSLALALVGRPRLLFLDEPTAGMDPRARLLTWEVVRERQRLGVTVMLTTHSMEEAERLADRVAIIHQGKLVALDTPDGLRRQAGPEVLDLELAGELDQELQRALTDLPAVESAERSSDGAYRVRSPRPREAAKEITALLADRGPALRQLRIGRGSLEDAFLFLTEDQPS